MSKFMFFNQDKFINGLIGKKAIIINGHERGYKISGYGEDYGLSSDVPYAVTEGQTFEIVGAAIVNNQIYIFSKPNTIKFYSGTFSGGIIFPLSAVKILS